MRILYTDSYHVTLNPTTTMLPALFAAAASDITYYGPGYSSAAELEKGIAAYVDRTGPYDGIVLGSNFPFFNKPDDPGLLNGSISQHRHNAFSSPIPIRMAYYRDVLIALPALPIKNRFGCLLGFDWYCASARHIDAIEAANLYIIAPDAGFARKLEEIPEWAWQEKHFIRKRNLITGEWNTYLKRRSDRVLSLHHFIGDNEFFLRGLADRRNTISVPGVTYVMRERALAALRRHDLKPSSKAFYYGFLVANRMRLPVFSKFIPLRMFNVWFQGDLADSRFAYTSPEGYGIAVRKFFEIPAAGAVLLCIPPHNFGALGFIAGQHYVEAEPDTLVEIVRELDRHPDRAQAIAAAGRKLVIEGHSLTARASQMARCFDAIEAGIFAGSAWREGEFVMFTTQDRSSAARDVGATAAVI
jgi:hypothetical protein